MLDPSDWYSVVAARLFFVHKDLHRRTDKGIDLTHNRTMAHRKFMPCGLFLIAHVDGNAD
jgi:hypothetical protein